MRSKPALASVAACVLSLLLAAGPAAAVDTSLTGRCAVADVVLKRLADKRAHSRRAPKIWFVADAAADATRDGKTAAELAGDPDWHMPPPIQLAQAYLAATVSGPVRDCQGFANRARTLGARQGDRRAERMAKANLLPGRLKVDVVTMSTPVLSADGREALVLVSGAAGFLWYMRRAPDGEWKSVDALMLWIT